MKCISSRSPTCALPEEGVVSELIDVDTAQWKRDLIFASFDRDVAQKIINTPLSFRLPSDSLSWPWEKDGLYSVRSAYHLLCDEKRKLQPGPSCPRQSKIWKEIWRTPVHDVQCPLCHMDVESSSHLFLECTLMKLTLFASHLGSHIPMSIDLHDWILSWLTCHDSLGTQLFCTLMWKFWTGRNNAIFKGVIIDPKRLAEEALQFVNDFNDANPTRIPRSSSHQTVVQPPSTPALFSMFVDAGCFPNGHTAWGLSIHNQVGETIFSACKRESISVEPVMAEALGVRWALQVAIDQGLSSVSISSDAANVVQCITKRAIFASIEIIAQDCRELMNNLVNVSVSFVRREQNSEAHNLVSLAKFVGNRSWLGAAPSVSFFTGFAAVPAVMCNQISCAPAPI